MQNYADLHGRFPPAYTVDANGNRLHSWRAWILPLMEAQNIYDKIDRSQPWDAPANAEARDTVMETYQCPSTDCPANHTTYLAVVGPGSGLQPIKSRTPYDFADGMSNTVNVIEVPADHAVPWMSPQDADEARFLSIGRDFKSAHVGGFNALFADGSVRLLPDDMTAEERRALMSIAGNDNDQLPKDSR